MRKKLLLTIVLIAPVILLGVIMLAIKYSRPAMNAPPIGAGAGDTGGANAIGELLAHGQTRSPNAPPPTPPQPQPPVTPPPTVPPPQPASNITSLSVAGPNGGGPVDVQVFALPGTGQSPMLLVIGDGTFDSGIDLDGVAAELIRAGRTSPFVIAAVNAAAVGPDAKWVHTSVRPALQGSYRPTEFTLAGFGAGAETALSLAAQYPQEYQSLAVLDAANVTRPSEEFQPPRRAVLVGASWHDLAAQLRGAGMDDTRLLVVPSNPGRAELEQMLEFLFPPDTAQTK